MTSLPFQTTYNNHLKLPVYILLNIQYEQKYLHAQ
jgi:hypothetical protein